MPTSAFQTASNSRLMPAFNDEDALMLVANLVTGTYAAGTALGEVTATPGTFKAYAHANTDGSEVCKGFLKWPCTVDGSGNITIEGDIFPAQQLTAEYYVNGFFQTQDLVGLDANGLADLKGRLIRGSLSSGVIEF